MQENGSSEQNVSSKSNKSAGKSKGKIVQPKCEICKTKGRKF